MARLGKLSGAMIVIAFLARGQELPSRPAFEVAAIRTPTFIHPDTKPKTLQDSHLDIETWSMQGLLCTAFGVKPYHLSGPDWMANTYFDIEAKLPDGATRSQIPLMLQSLLADRFGLLFHTEMRAHAIQALVVDRGGLKVPARPRGDDPSRLLMRPAEVAGRRGMYVEVSSLIKLADFLSIELEKPVVDETGLPGSFDIKFQFPMEPTSNEPIARPAGVPIDPGGLPELVHEVEKLGLKLEPRKDLLKLIVVEHLERTPTGN